MIDAQDIRRRIKRREARLRVKLPELFTSKFAAVTSLSFGLLFPLLDPDAKLSFLIMNRAPTDEEWAEWSKQAYAARYRRADDVIVEEAP